MKAARPAVRIRKPPSMDAANRPVLRGKAPPNPLRSLRRLRSRTDRRCGARSARAARRSRPDRAFARTGDCADRSRAEPVSPVFRRSDGHRTLDSILPARHRGRPPPNPPVPVGSGGQPARANRARPAGSRHSRRPACSLAGRDGRGDVVRWARGAVTALSVLGASGSDVALSTLADLSSGSRAQDLALIGLGGAALRDPGRVLTWLSHLPSARRPGVVDLLRSAFERFEDDFSEEQFFAATRAEYWRSPEGAPERELMAALIQKLEF